MQLGDPASGDALELRVVGYEFPDVQDDAYDSDWLVIAGTVDHDGRSWTFREPCLLADEARALAEWLSSPSTAPPAFIEPLLEVAHDEGILRVSLGAEAVEPGGDPGERVNLRIPVSAPALADAASAWRASLAEFPPRAVA